MEQTQEKSRISVVNIVFLITMGISIVTSFLPLDFLKGNYALQLVFSQLILVLPTVVYMIKYKQPYRQTVRLNKMKFGDIGLMVLFMILIQPVINFVNALSLVFTENAVSTVMLDLSEQVPLKVALVLVALVPCIFEETVYRGVLYTEYSKADPWKAVLMSGFLFGLMHGNFNQFCYAAVLGMILALVMEATGSILSTMLLHFLINANSVINVYLLPKVYEVLQIVYQLYKDAGEEDAALYLEALFGDLTLNSSEWVRQYYASAADVELTVSTVIGAFGMQALIMGYLAFLVFRKLAKRNGNWERICGFVGHKKEDAEPILTVPLMLAICLGVMFIFFYELLRKFPIITG